MPSFASWLRNNVDGILASVIAGTTAVLIVPSVLGIDLLGAGERSGAVTDVAILIVLALLAIALLRDRSSTARVRDDASAVQVVHGADLDRLHAEAYQDTDRWLFKGGIGTHLRTVTLKECVDNARAAQRPTRIQIEIIDPTDEALCTEYAQYRSSLNPGSDRHGEKWTTARVQREALATILAACWYRERFTLLRVEIALSRVMTTLRWDLSSNWIILTQDESAAPAVLFERSRPHYRAYDRELAASFEQAKRVDVALAKELRLSDEPTVDEVRTLFGTLAVTLPESFTDTDVTDIVRRALHPKDSPQRAASSQRKR
ncbi:hypothetical protein [Actinoalloteichus hymeniacidonis]|uniref:Uncharacterized protein n=1 Tax=Actinoalloteichus hymeniacidonis TaxID=340345 RepID=A0AAC9MYX1_9PSEU|nr:hypothetical protein [Actinoalloteichus hymeniacidonis]AOS63316.1 hypothetical protein TL08_12510 [Actinoalloteichus hymeniacidonis]MBB5908645.1 hypothetical protein [Actinoalloteichus hymeniacidonis]